MARYKVILAYDGTAFHGSQRQRGARTVQGEFEAALRQLGWTGRTVLLAGRTDAGVHAEGQVAAFDLPWRHSAQDLRNALNALLPPDLSVRQARQCAPDFHPRYDARARTYHYRVLVDAAPHPLKERYAWRVHPQPDMRLLQHLAAQLRGEHDFAAFGRPMRKGGSTRRTVMAARWYHLPDYLLFEITANAFLYHMVRRLVYVQVMTALGRLSPQTVVRHLEQPGERPLQGLAPAAGLSLVSVTYERE
ncbi:MAG: tRNA pseudouridine(38-40) synthase TruA [Anaerolineae bacterium]|nr:MAG: tRNA pseudouridine(38-40) synthase TruA [Anaerolineae bacterium]